jgi:hypothetical protein
VVVTILKNMKVDGKDDIPIYPIYEMEHEIHVPNHQPEELNGISLGNSPNAHRNVTRNHGNQLQIPYKWSVLAGKIINKCWFFPAVCVITRGYVFLLWFFYQLWETCVLGLFWMSPTKIQL